MAHSVRVFPTTNDLSQFLAEILVRDIDRVEHEQYYSLALSGGSTPLDLFRYLSENFVERISWDKLLIFWVDERCVPPESDESNYKAAYETLLQNVPVPDSNVFRIRGEADPQAEARQYSELVSANIPFYNGVPQFDLMLLGLGGDGHTASIFPDNMNLLNTSNLYEVAVKPDNRQKRITATGKLINNSARVCFVVTGKEKAEIVSNILDKKSGWDRYPAARVNPASGQLLWLLDQGAALNLSRPQK